VKSKQLTIKKKPLVLFVSILVCISLLYGYGLLKSTYISAGSIVPESPVGFSNVDKTNTGSQIKTFVYDYYDYGTDTLHFIFFDSEALVSDHNTLTVSGGHIHDSIVGDADATPSTTQNVTCILSGDENTGYASVICGFESFKMYYKTVL
jgi:hypothetical protein